MRFIKKLSKNWLAGMLVLLSGLILLPAKAGYAQQDPVRLGSTADSLSIVAQPWISENIHPGLIWKKAHFQNLFDSRQMVNYLEIDLNNPEINVAFDGVPTGFKRTSEFVKEAGALAGINATFFNTSTGGSVTLLKIDGQLLNETTLLLANGQRNERANGAVLLEKEANNGKQRVKADIFAGNNDNLHWDKEFPGDNIMVCGPVLVMDGQAAHLQDNAFNKNRHPRSAVALLPGNKLILMTVDGRNAEAQGMSLHELAFLLKILGAEKALNLDGGGSTALYIEGIGENGIVNYPSDNSLFDHDGERRVANAILVTTASFMDNQVIAHRGAWKKDGLPQNSIASLQKAISLGVAGTEFDVHLTKDNVLVVNHDNDYNGIEIATATYKELLAVKLPNGEKIPTAEEYIREGMKQKGTKLIFELKTSPLGPERTEDSAVLAVELVKSLQAEEWIEYILFSYEGAKKIIELDPRAKVWYLLGDVAPAQAKADGFYGLDYHYRIYRQNPEWIKEAHDLGLLVNVWTVNNADEMRILLDQNVEFITTDEPELLFEVLSERK
ncbi:MAG TPA: phosphodiester glycosidase family protein [Sphingobacteriaceae bacterium]|nr:phosphodiester glycosidase family protein [Sphingobacteriaceae bacterium]